MEREKVTILYKKYPMLFFVLPFLGGFFAWYFSQSSALGLFITLVGLVLNSANWLLMKRKK